MHPCFALTKVLGHCMRVSLCVCVYMYVYLSVFISVDISHFACVHVCDAQACWDVMFTLMSVFSCCMCVLMCKHAPHSPSLSALILYGCMDVRVYAFVHTHRIH
jgi:hypothetical protein